MNSSKYLEFHKANIGLYEEFINEILFTIKEECKVRNLKFADVKGRVKTLESIEEKIKRHQIANPDKEIFDYAGVRLLCLFESEKQEFSKMIESLFVTTWYDNKKEKLGANQMGYQSIHYCIKFGNAYSGPRYKKFNNFVCEIQITTVLLEAWALINHTIVYKNESSVPINIQRDLNNLSSLLEVAQRIFDDSSNKRGEYIKQLENLVSDNELLSQLIDYDSLTVYSNNLFPKIEISEYWQNKLLGSLNKNKYYTLKDIDAVVKKARPFIEYYQTVRPDLFEYSTDILTKSLGFIDLEFRNEHNFAEPTLRAFEYYENHKATTG